MSTLGRLWYGNEKSAERNTQLFASMSLVKASVRKTGGVELSINDLHHGFCRQKAHGEQCNLPYWRQRLFHIGAMSSGLRWILENTMSHCRFKITQEGVFENDQGDTPLAGKFTAGLHPHAWPLSPPAGTGIATSTFGRVFLSPLKDDAALVPRSTPRNRPETVPMTPECPTPHDPDNFCFRNPCRIPRSNKVQNTWESPMLSVSYYLICLCYPRL